MLGDDFRHEPHASAGRLKRRRHAALESQQIGTLTEAAELPSWRDAGWKVTISARAAETEQLAGGPGRRMGGRSVKVGSIAQSERLPYNAQHSKRANLPVVHGLHHERLSVSEMQPPPVPS